MSVIVGENEYGANYRGPRLKSSLECNALLRGKPRQMVFYAYEYCLRNLSRCRF